MRLLLFFDLPVETTVNRRDYRHFVKYLEKDGFIRIQESVYAKLAIDNHVIETTVSKLLKNKPPLGLVQVLKVTEKQYVSMKTITGSGRESDEVTDTSELIIL